jgi:NDP-sugar pyrophosphorylase family protein
MKVILVCSFSSSNSFLDYDDSEVESSSISLNYSLQIFGKPIIARNIEILDSLYDIEKIVIPKKLRFLTSIINSSYGGEVEEIDNKEYGKLMENDFGGKVEKGDLFNSYNGTKNNSIKKFNHTQSVLVSNKTTLFLPDNAILGKNSSKRNLKFQLFRYPWEFLEIVNDLLQSEIKTTCISNTADVAKSSIIDGPCIVEDNVTIDDFVKVKGPAYIGKGSFIGMGSLIRNSMLDYNTHIGFNCEIGKSYFAGNAKISHHNVILDSIIGKNVWFGGYSGTANVLLNRKNVFFKIKDKLLDTGRVHFGAVVYNNSSIGAAVIILPGRKIPPNSVIQAGTIYGK